MSDIDIASVMQAHLDDLTKPRGSLGKLEQYAARLATIQQRVPPTVRRKAVFVLAGDHGITGRGVSLYPREVTGQMVRNMMAGGAAINVLSRACGYDVCTVDTGVDADLSDLASQSSFLDMKAVRGSADFIAGPALTAPELERCLDNGRRLADIATDRGYDIVAIGDMGIGNTTSAAAILAAFGFSLDTVVDRGTGIDDTTLQTKRNVIAQGLAARGFRVGSGEAHTGGTGADRTTGAPVHGPDSGAKAEAILAAFAGPEIATAAGLILGLRGRRIACMIDGFPVTAAAYAAWRIDPSIINYLFAGHQSKVRGHRPVLDAMGLDPIVSLDMRLGEGTGAVVGGFLVELGARIAGEMATFSSMSVSKAASEEKDY